MELGWLFAETDQSGCLTLSIAIVISTGLLIFTGMILNAIGNRSKKLAEKISKSRIDEINKENNTFIHNKTREIQKGITEKHFNEETALRQGKQKLDLQEKLIKDMTHVFNENFTTGKQWLAKWICEANTTIDNQIISHLQIKSHPAIKAAEAVRQAKRETREAEFKLKLLEFQIETYHSYFPNLLDYSDEILKWDDSYIRQDESDETDPVSLYLSQEEYKELPTEKRNQIALDNYTKRNKNHLEIGRMYERYLGYQYEANGWDVSYFGAIHGFEDLGRDLICKKGNITHIVQAKCWSPSKTIHEKHIFQLFGTALLYEIETQNPGNQVKAIFATTATLSKVASAAADRLGIQVNITQLPKTYPMIKCNINAGNKIYHLPFDQQYDRVKIINPGEHYALTVKDAETAGFRRAFKYHPNTA